jgi:hypothetical protein
VKIRGRWLVLACALHGAASAEVVRIEVLDRAPVAAGAAFGATGAYERLAGKIHFAVDPHAAANAAVADIAFAPANAEGRVQFAADFYLLKPAIARRGNGTLLFEVANRGGKGILPMLNHGTRDLDPITSAALGDGFLLQRGYTLLWVGWQHDVPAGPNLLHVYPPRAAGVAGLVRSNFVVRQPAADHGLGDGDHAAYPVADPASPRNALTVRDAPLAERRVVPRSEWTFGRAENAGSTGVIADLERVQLTGGFQPRQIYEVTYEARDPPLAGLGLVAIRDAVARLKYTGDTALGIAADALPRALAFGISQSGRLLRTFLHDGFNTDERGRQVFDGLLVHIAGGARGSFNVRFAQPSRSSASYLYPNEIFPFTDAAQTDPVTGATGGLLANIDAAALPKIFYTNSANEYWRGSAALTHVSVDGRRDFAPPPTSRIYLFAGAQHTPAPFPPRVGAGRLPSNPLDYSWFLRALLVALDAWVKDDTAPPPSRYPTRAAQTLVERADLAFPLLPDVEVPAAQPVVRLDFGPDFAARRVTREPPTAGAPYPFLVPQVDADGNELGGLKLPALAAPLATYTGWNLYAPDNGRPGELVSLQGSYVPLAADRAARERSGDPRPSIAERYRDRDHYLALVAERAQPLIATGHLLAADLAEIVRQAGEHWDHLARR